MRSRCQYKPQDSYKLRVRNRKRCLSVCLAPRTVPAQPSLPLKCQRAKPLARVLPRPLPHACPVSEAGHPGNPQATMWWDTLPTCTSSVPFGGAGSSHSEKWPRKVLRGWHCQVLLSFLLISFRKGNIGDLSSSTAKTLHVCFTVGSGVEVRLRDLFLCLLPFHPLPGGQTHFRWTGGWSWTNLPTLASSEALAPGGPWGSRLCVRLFNSAWVPVRPCHL